MTKRSQSFRFQSLKNRLPRRLVFLALLVTLPLGAAFVGARFGGGEVSAVHAATPAPPAAPTPPGATGVTPKIEMPAEARALSAAFAAAAKALRPSVVRIDVESGPPAVAGRRGRPNGPGGRDLPDIFRHFFDMEPGEGFGGPGGGQRKGVGSGVIIDNTGNIVTNRHVVEGASKVTVTMWDGVEVSAKVVGADPRTDVAVVRLEKVPKGIVVARIGDSEKLEVGEWVLAIGSRR